MATNKNRLAMALAIFAAATMASAAPSVRNSMLRRGATNPAAPAEPPRSSAVETPATPEQEASDLYIPEGTSLEMIFKIYGQLVNRTVLKDPSVADVKITLVSRPGQKLTREEQIEAIEVVLEMNGVHMENYGEKFVRALPRDKARQEGIPLIVDQDAELEDSGRVVSMMIPFKNIPMDEAKTVLEGLKSQKGLLLVYERIGKILVTDTQLNINRMRQIAREIDVATPINENVFVRQIKNASAADIKTALEQIVTESQKELEKAGQAAKTVQAGDGRPGFSFRDGRQPGGPLLRRPGQPAGKESAAPANVESLVTSVSDADRGMIRGKVLIMADERSNKLIVVTAKTNMDFFDKVIEQLDVETTPDTVVKVYRLKYADAEDVSDMINDLIGGTSSRNSSGGKSQNQNQNAKRGTNTNMTRNTPQPQNAARTGANQRSGEAKAGELSKDNTTVLADKRINGLVVMTDKELVPTIETIIESMDIKLSQVLIETAIIEVTLGDDLKTGIDWVQRGRQRVTTQQQTTELIRDGFVNNGHYGLGGGGGTGSDLLNTVMNVGTNATSAFFGGANPIGAGVNYLLKSDKLNLSAVIHATKTDTRAKYIASPVVMTVDNKEAVVEATESRKFYSGSTTTGSSSYPVTSYNYTDKDIGITIKLTPKINPNGTVMLKIEEEYSQLGGTQTVLVSGKEGDTKPETIDTAVQRKMSADVLLDDGHTVVLGGLTETYKSSNETGIPILKDIPWIGKWLFGSVTETETRKELLVFLTPYVLDDAEAAQREAARRKSSLSDARAWENTGWTLSPLADAMPKRELMRKLKDEAKRQDEDRQNRLAVEKWKLDRAKEIESMDEAERNFWIEAHREELEKEEREKFDAELKEQADLKTFAEQLRASRIARAEAAAEASAAAEREKALQAAPAAAESAKEEPAQ